MEEPESGTWQPIAEEEIGSRKYTRKRFQDKAGRKKSSIKADPRRVK